MADLLLLCNPGNERVARFQAALSSLGHPPAELLAWSAFLDDPARLDARLRPETILRIESPGENLDAERRLLARGAAAPDERFDAPRISSRDALRLPEERGRIRFPRQFHLGFRAALREIGRRAVRAMNDPAEIRAMGDKPTCHERLSALGVPRPRVIGFPRSFAELQEAMARAGRLRVFVKLANGSSASGVVAYQTDGRRHLAITSAEMASGRLYNSTRIRRYESLADVRALFDALCPEGVLAEEWIPKASLRGRPFDLRVLVIAGRARHVAVRSSPTPLTNLHLGRDNRREPPAAVRAKLGDEAWEAALRVAERAVADGFPKSLYAGVDLLVGSGRHRPAVLEVNAFGDLLRRTLHEGRDPYEAEIEALSQEACRD